MLALIQRVSEARVDVAGQVIGAIDQGLLVLVCAEPSDTEAIADKLVAKLLKLRVFSDDAGKMNRSVVDVQGGLLIVSQFTLAADTSAGNRPSFTGAAPAALGRQLYERVLAVARAQHGLGRILRQPLVVLEIIRAHDLPSRRRVPRRSDELHERHRSVSRVGARRDAPAIRCADRTRVQRRHRVQARAFRRRKGFR